MSLISNNIWLAVTNKTHSRIKYQNISYLTFDFHSDSIVAALSVREIENLVELCLHSEALIVSLCITYSFIDPCRACYNSLIKFWMAAEDNLLV